MQFDKTRLVIRERGLLEILDLALRIIKEYSAPVFFTFVAGAVPLALLNDYLIGWMDDYEFEDYPIYNHMHFLLAASILVFLEAPVASIFTTMFLGRAIFYEQPSWQSMLRDSIRLFPSLVVCQGFFRGILLTLILLWIIPHDDNWKTSVHLALILSALYAVTLRARRPYLNEVILLERTPILARDASTITLGRRMSTLHQTSACELVGRWLGSVLFAGILSLVGVVAAWTLSWIIENDFDWGPFLTRVGAPVSLWSVAMFFSVVRFLGYLDCRIRNEGWQVELQLRAEAARLKEQWG